MEDTTTALVVQPGDAGTASLTDGTFELLADGGAVSASRLTLASGADGAPPHRHKLSHETFYLLDGTMVFRLGDAVTTVGKGGLVIIPPGLPHAFGAAEGETADVVVFLSPGIERFAYFEQLAAISRGELDFASLVPVQDRYDVHLIDLPDWRSAP
ncbi:cupin domain-containing protein [Actinacidiphila acidipaludis]|uniref:Cupin domain-containing protein n=1 Tax=Actinacidiphila acidipaludis TaxID=2873382 RepID=A0ABS7Q294_9ACTN|nr:cupin domain-containing protein [Streptomyces acidipaludis]MBY8877235.1 cupin domain-containing protein [Streptomyces acidipaludis]